jgi:hypothetical protein
MNAVTLFGVLAVSFMMVMYALEQRRPIFILAFALGCVLSSAYGFLSGAWPFGVVELIWSGVALRRYLARRRGSPGTKMARKAGAAAARQFVQQLTAEAASHGISSRARRRTAC